MLRKVQFDANKCATTSQTCLFFYKRTEALHLQHLIIIKCIFAKKEGKLIVMVNSFTVFYGEV